MQGISVETEQLLHKTNALADDIQQKSQSLNKVVAGVDGIGTTIQSLNTKLRNVSDSVTDEIENNADKVAQVVQWSSAAIEVYNHYRASRQEKKVEKEERKLERIEKKAEKKEKRSRFRMRGES
ncbi:Uncharacterized protein containing a divergent version of the methyl-accepting chemotaxis-like domain [Streptococcus pneumoniae]|nr:Uncharacterized protein containing a divergent version of the methyl-accepting chemotaxis-like domain [Streptococcus pneumoniae]